MIKVSELQGLESMKALNVFHKLMLGLKMLPSYFSVGYEEFYQSISEMPDEDQLKMIREAALFVDLDKSEVEAMTYFCLDPNGVRYRSENLKNLKPDQLYEMIVAVAVEISKIKINFVTESEKKKLKTSQ